MKQFKSIKKNNSLLTFGFSSSYKKAFIKTKTLFFIPDEIWVYIKELAGIYNFSVNWNCENEIFMNCFIETMPEFLNKNRTALSMLPIHLLFWRKMKENKRDKKQLLQKFGHLVNQS